MTSPSIVYDLRGKVLAGGLVSDVEELGNTVGTARTMARRSRRSVVVEDQGAGEVYRVTPSGRIRRVPRGWPVPTWALAYAGVDSEGEPV